MVWTSLLILLPTSKKISIATMMNMIASKDWHVLQNTREKLIKFGIGEKRGVKYKKSFGF